MARTRAAGVDIVKVGLFEPRVENAFLKTLATEASKGLRIVAVFFADCQPELPLLQQLAAMGVIGVMLDTADKRRGSLRHVFTHEQIEDFITHARALGRLAATGRHPAAA